MAKKILVVDDDADTRMLMKKLLEDEGYHVSTAKNGRECIEKLKKEKIDLVLMDMFMSGMSGRETCAQIRRDPQIKDTRIAFLTVAEFGAEGEDRLKKLSILDYIRKPIDNEDFRKRIKEILKLNFKK